MRGAIEATAALVETLHIVDSNELEENVNTEELAASIKKHGSFKFLTTIGFTATFSDLAATRN